jgi:hypothetical protein
MIFNKYENKKDIIYIYIYIYKHVYEIKSYLIHILLLQKLFDTSIGSTLQCNHITEEMILENGTDRYFEEFRSSRNMHMKDIVELISG